MYYVGLDVHYLTSTYCILNAHGRELKCETIRGHWPKLLDRLAAIKGNWSDLQPQRMLHTGKTINACGRESARKTFGHELSHTPGRKDRGHDLCSLRASRPSLVGCSSHVRRWDMRHKPWLATVVSYSVDDSA